MTFVLTTLAEAVDTPENIQGILLSILNQKSLAKSFRTAVPPNSTALLLLLGWLGLQGCALGQNLSETVLHDFGGAPSDGSAPLANLIQGTDGSFYGTTQGGGTNGNGAIFKITADGTGTLLYSFAATSGGGYNGAPVSPLLQGTDGTFYGTSAGGDLSNGIIFNMTPAGTVTILHTFGVRPDGAQPATGLIESGDDNFYGTTEGGGTGNINGGGGIVFKMSVTRNGAGQLTGSTMTTLHNFLDGTVAGDGYRPVSGLIQGIDGSLYGTTYDGGANGVGTVFKLTPPSGVGTTWTESILYSFGSSANDGTNPQAPLVFGPDGSLYDTTPMGGISNRGTVFKLTSSSGVWTETILHIFDVPNGTVPQAGLVRGADGNFYGTASTGGASQGTIFAVTPRGSIYTAPHFRRFSRWVVFRGKHVSGNGW